APELERLRSRLAAGGADRERRLREELREAPGLGVPRHDVARALAAGVRAPVLRSERRDRDHGERGEPTNHDSFFLHDRSSVRLDYPATHMPPRSSTRERFLVD